jgi:DNA-directed RNA polymerase subunit RPC12/RpoP
MDIVYNCDKCNQQVAIDGAGEGLIVQCPTCGANLTVPKAEDAKCVQIEDGKVGTYYPSQIRLPNIGEQVEYKIEKDGKARFLNSEKLHFYGQCSHSPDNRFILVWEESGFHPFTGKRKWGLYFLLDGNRAIAAGTMQRPNDGKVSNSGNFILNDWMIIGSETLAGTFYAFTPNGEILVSKEFKANLDGNGISDDGQFAFCGTAMSNYIDHNDKTFIFDLKSKTLIATIEGHAGKVKVWNLVERMKYQEVR